MDKKELSKKGPPLKPSKDLPLKQENDVEPITRDEPEVTDPKRIEEPGQKDPLHIQDPPPSQV